MDHHPDPPDLLLLRRRQLGRLWLRLQQRLRLWLRLRLQQRLRLRLQRRLRLLQLRSAEKRSARELGAERKQEPKAHAVGLGLA